MNAYQANVLVHVDGSHDIDPLAALRDCLGDVAGVTDVRPSARPHLTWVDYNPGVTTGRDIFAHVQRQGLRAQLVGM